MSSTPSSLGFLHYSYDWQQQQQKRRLRVSHRASHGDRERPWSHQAAAVLVPPSRGTSPPAPLRSRSPERRNTGPGQRTERRTAQLRRPAQWRPDGRTWSRRPETMQINILHWRIPRDLNNCQMKNYLFCLGYHLCVLAQLITLFPGTAGIYFLTWIALRLNIVVLGASIWCRLMVDAYTFGNRHIFSDIAIFTSILDFDQ